jgi:hypothetical protein
MAAGPLKVRIFFPCISCTAFDVLVLSGVRGGAGCFAQPTKKRKMKPAMYFDIRFSKNPFNPKNQSA